jgi:hypothetical protein
MLEGGWRQQALGFGKRKACHYPSSQRPQTTSR